MGGILRVNIHYIDIKKIIASARENNIPIYGTCLDGENIYETEMSLPGILIMGNESKGISKEIKDQLSQNLLIPGFNTGKTGSESLNVSTATAIVLSEFRRQQHYSKWNEIINICDFSLSRTSV